MLKINDLAAKIHEVLADTDKNNDKIALTPENTAEAAAIIESLKAMEFSHDTVTGNAPSSVIALNGKLASISESIWVSEIKKAVPLADNDLLVKEARISLDYIKNSAKIEFKSGDITGVMVPFSQVSGNFTVITGKNGKIKGLNGGDWAEKLQPAMPDAWKPDSLARMRRLYTKICKYMADNAECIYAPGGIVDTQYTIAGGAIVPTRGAQGKII